VGNGNIDVGNKTATRKPGQPVAERVAKGDGEQQNPLKTRQRRICGAMSQQCGDNGRGHQSAPQKFVQLVGYRDPKGRAEPWVRPGPAPVKR
jgi:hypothetical protein